MFYKKGKNIYTSEPPKFKYKWGLKDLILIAALIGAATGLVLFILNLT